MDLHGATSATEDDVRIAFATALDQADRVFRAASEGGVDAEALARHDEVRISITDLIDEIGTGQFRRLYLAQIFQSTFIDSFRDWPLFVIANALEYCHNAVMNGDGTKHNGMGSLTDGLALLMELNMETVEVTLINAKRTWTPGVKAEIEARLIARGIFGTWMCVIDFISTKVYVYHPLMPYETKTLIGQDLPVTLVEKTIALESEALAMRTTLMATLSAEAVKKTDELAELARRIAGLAREVAPEEPEE